MTTYPLFALQDLIRVHYGKGLKTAERDESGQYHVYGSSGAIGKHSSVLVEHATIIIGRKGSVGEVTYAPEGGWPIDTTFYAEVLNPDRLDLRFLYYALRRARLDKHTITTSIPGINRGDIYRAKIPLPSLPEQRRIAAILDKADTIRRKRQEAILLVEEFLHSVFSDMFGNIGSFEHVKIQDIARKKKHALSSGPFGSNLTSAHYTNEGVIVLRGLNISDGRPNLDDVKFVSEEKAQSLVRSEVGPGDIVVVAVGSSGLACQIPNSLPRAIMSQNFNKITPDRSKINPTFLEYCLNSRFIQQQLKQEITDTVRTFLSLTKMKTIEIPLPPLRDQDNFAQIVQKSEQLRTKQMKTKRKSDDVFNSLLQRAFRGELKSTQAKLVKNRENRNSKWGWTKVIV